MGEDFEIGRRRSIFRKRYDNFIGGRWIPPIDGEYFENLSPVDGQLICEVPRSRANDVETALDAASAAARVSSSIRSM